MLLLLCLHLHLLYLYQHHLTKNYVGAKDWIVRCLYMIGTRNCWMGDPAAKPCCGPIVISAASLPSIQTASSARSTLICASTELNGWPEITSVWGTWDS